MAYATPNLGRVIFEPVSGRGLVIIFWPDLRRAVVACPWRAADLSYEQLGRLVASELQRRS